MKGPSGRTRFDVRRVWDCPVCQRREWTRSNVVHRLCPACQTRTDAPAEVWMQLVETPGKTAGR
jgi:hypothetical protein